MAQAGWATCWDPRVLLAALRGRASDRKLRLFACACVRRIWHLLGDPRSRAAVEIVERHTDGKAGARELTAAWAAAATAAGDDRGGTAARNAAANAAMAAESAAGTDAWAVARDVSCWTVLATAWNAIADVPVGRQDASCGDGRVRIAAEKNQCRLLRDLFGDARDRIITDPTWLHWNDCTVVRLALAAYEHREMPSGLLDNVRLAILADALEDAGCADRVLLAHLREDAEHVRGCHVLDALLARS
jgi:hypothetical protein